MFFLLTSLKRGSYIFNSQEFNGLNILQFSRFNKIIHHLFGLGDTLLFSRTDLKTSFPERIRLLDYQIKMSIQNVLC